MRPAANTRVDWCRIADVFVEASAFIMGFEPGKGKFARPMQATVFLPGNEDNKGRYCALPRYILKRAFSVLGLNVRTVGPSHALAGRSLFEEAGLEGQNGASLFHG